MRTSLPFLKLRRGANENIFAVPKIQEGANENIFAFP
jgi:hypothetical protein